MHRTIARRLDIVCTGLVAVALAGSIYAIAANGVTPDGAVENRSAAATLVTHAESIDSSVNPRSFHR